MTPEGDGGVKILLLGSHPSVIEIRKYRESLLRVYAAVYSLNNAWDVLGAFPQHWLHSSDFRRLGTLRPRPQQRGEFLEERDTFVKSPKWYQFPGTGTMLLNGVYHIYNTLHTSGLSEIHLFGLDCEYSDPSQTHFYGRGKTNQKTRELLQNTQFAGIAADPIRFGTDPLKDALARIEVDLFPVAVWSLSANPNQLLPFRRLTLQELFPDEAPVESQ